jgi:hypothetical protein
MNRRARGQDGNLVLIGRWRLRRRAFHWATVEHGVFFLVWAANARRCAGRSHLNSTQINPMAFDAAEDTGTFVGAKNFSPLHLCSIANLLIPKKFRCDHPAALRSLLLKK